MFNLNKYVLQEECEGFGSSLPDFTEDNPYKIIIKKNRKGYLEYEGESYTFQAEELSIYGVVRIYKPIWGGLSSKMVYVSSSVTDSLSGTLSAVQVEKAKPNDLIDWYTNAFIDYIEIKNAWSEVE